jgi:hypothetical protein
MTSRASRACASLLLLIILLLPSIPAFAQTPAPDAAAATPPARPGREYGVRFGPAFTSLTSVETFDDTVVGSAPETTMNFGGYVRMHVSGALSFQPEVLFAAKGQRIHDKDAQPTISGTGTRPPQADRVVLIRYLEIPLLVRATKRMRADSSVYLIAGPALAMRRGAVIRQVVDSGKLEDIADQVSGSNFSLVYGGGIQHQRWLVDARFTRGLQNIAVVPQPAAVKTGGFAVLLGVRL